MTDNWIGITFGTGFILMGILFLSLTILNIYFNRKTNNWKSLKGKIIDSRFTKTIEQYSIDLDFASSTEIKYKNNIKFEYKIDEYTYVSEKIFYLEFNNWLASNKFKKRLAKLYIKDKKVWVFLNPKDNNKGFLVEKAPISTVLFYAILSLSGGLFLILS